MTKSKSEIEKGINVLLNIDDPSSYSKVLKTMEFYGIDEINAKEYFLFIPIVFCRLMLPKIKFPEFYFEQDSKDHRIKRKFKSNLLFKEIEAEVKNFFDTAPDGEKILKIASLSSEFGAINELLNKGGNLEDIRLTEMIVIK